LSRRQLERKREREREIELDEASENNRGMKE